jgi:predicted transcriptional regulator
MGSGLSCQQKAILFELMKSPKHAKDLKKSSNYTHCCIYRSLSNLEKHQMIEKQKDGSYKITMIGRVNIAIFEGYI